MDKVDDFYRPPTSSGYAPGDTPKMRGVHKSDHYRPLYRHIPSSGIHHSDRSKEGEVPTSKHIKVEPKKSEQTIPMQAATAHGLNLARARNKQLQGFKDWRPSRRPPADYTGSTTLLSFGSDMSTSHFQQKGSSLDASTSGKSGSSVLSSHDEGLYDEKAATLRPLPASPTSRSGHMSALSYKMQYLSEQKKQLSQLPGTTRRSVVVADPASSRRLFGGIIKSRRPAIPTNEPTPSSSALSDTKFENRLLTRPTSSTISTDPSLSARYELRLGFKPMPRSPQLSTSYPLSTLKSTLSPTGTNTKPSTLAPSLNFERTIPSACAYAHICKFSFQYKF
ncbi:uncharacterized protein RCO7_01139 [Rhynchosporium graminicola]|uniref:Uncharacterized protein n=1 Tax=Rhynchosporium graminicola TaxID=2792576 RepID=A0A1E1JQY7_9HELO|nr:uncharacterized protein RCO7_01139 [Rhynchosporium commune]